MNKSPPTRNSRRKEALISSPSPGGVPENSPAIYCWVPIPFIYPSPEGTAEFPPPKTSRHVAKFPPLSLTPSLSWVLAEPGTASTVSTVSPQPDAASLSQRDPIIQPRVDRRGL